MRFAFGCRIFPNLSSSRRIYRVLPPTYSHILDRPCWTIYRTHCCEVFHMHRIWPCQWAGQAWNQFWRRSRHHIDCSAFQHSRTSWGHFLESIFFALIGLVALSPRHAVMKSKSQMFWISEVVSCNQNVFSKDYTLVIVIWPLLMTHIFRICVRLTCKIW